MTEPSCGAPAPDLHARIESLRQEAQDLASQEIEALRVTLAAAVRQAQAISCGGEIYPVGVREQARRLSDDLPDISNTLLALTDRHLRPQVRRLS